MGVGVIPSGTPSIPERFCFNMGSGISHFNVSLIKSKQIIMSLLFGGFNFVLVHF